MLKIWEEIACIQIIFKVRLKICGGKNNDFMNHAKLHAEIVDGNMVSGKTKC